VLRAQLLEKGQVLAGEGAQEVRLNHPEPTRDRARQRSKYQFHEYRSAGRVQDATCLDP
jgi:hypothetical protein